MKKEKNSEPQILMTLKTDVRREVRRTTPMWDLMAMHYGEKDKNLETS